MRKSALLFGALAITVLAAASAAVAGGWWTPWPGSRVQGVDVSHHQGMIDWRALASDNVRFVYIKASEGADHIDPLFRANWNGAGEAGLYRGAYHFFTLCQPGARQAANFIAVAPRISGALPPALDLEHTGPCRNGPTMPDVVAEARDFLDRAEAHYGVRPILYTTREFHDAHLLELSGEHFWIRSLVLPPRFRRNDWVIWQYHHRGRRRGIAGPVDLDVFRGNENELAAFAASARPTT